MCVCSNTCERSWSFSTNEAPRGGSCNVKDVENLTLLDEYELECQDWYDPDGGAGLTYNALRDGAVLLESEFQSSPGMVRGTVSYGTTSIVALIQDNDGGIACDAFEV